MFNYFINNFLFLFSSGASRTVEFKNQDSSNIAELSQYVLFTVICPRIENDFST